MDCYITLCVCVSVLKQCHWKYGKHMFSGSATYTEHIGQGYTFRAKIFPQSTLLHTLPWRKKKIICFSIQSDQNIVFVSIQSDHNIVCTQNNQNIVVYPEWSKHCCVYPEWSKHWFVSLVIKTLLYLSRVIITLYVPRIITTLLSTQSDQNIVVHPEWSKHCCLPRLIKTLLSTQTDQNIVVHPDWSKHCCVYPDWSKHCCVCPVIKALLCLFSDQNVVSVHSNQNIVVSICWWKHCCVYPVMKTLLCLSSDENVVSIQWSEHCRAYPVIKRLCLSRVIRTLSQSSLCVTAHLAKYLPNTAQM